MNEDQFLKLREILLTQFSEDELQTLSAELGVDYAKLPGEGQYGKSRNLIATLRERDRLPDLRARVKALKPAQFETMGLDKVVIDDPVSTQGFPNRLAYIVLGLVGLLLLACLFTYLMRPSTPAAETAATPVVAVNKMQDPTPVAQAIPPTQAPTGLVATATASPVLPTDTPAPPTATAIPPTPLPSPTASLSESHPAALAIPEFNQQLIPYFRGETQAAALVNWRGVALQGVVTFSKGALLKRLSITENERKLIEATVTYEKQPMLTAQKGNTFTVQTREYWTYSTNPRNSVCETRDYVYTVVKEGDKLQVAQSTSKLLGSACK